MIRGEGTCRLTAFRSPIEQQYHLALRLSILDDQESLDCAAGLFLLDPDVGQRDHKVVLLPHFLQLHPEICRKWRDMKGEVVATAVTSRYVEKES